MFKTQLRLTAALLSASVCFMPGVASAVDNSPATVLSEPGSRQPVLRRLPLGTDGLTFSGENGARDIPVYVSAAETAGTARLVLNLQSAVSILPSASEMMVLVNDTMVGRTKLADMDRKEFVADLPPGLLQPGFNAVSLVVNQTHRVDCSVDATYELWTRIDPATSGLLLSAGATEIRTLADLPGLGRGTDGQLVLRGRVPADASSKEIETTLAALQAVVVAGGIDRPSIEFNELPGSGDGFDVAIGTVESLRRTGIEAGEIKEPRVTITPATDRSRALLTIAAPNEGALTQILQQFSTFAEDQRPAGSLAGLQAFDNGRGKVLESGSKVTLGDLGFREPSFAGRFYRDQVKFVLPADFYAADYADAAINLEAAYAANLTQGAQLLVRANGRIVSTLGLSSFRGGTLSNQRLPIPLSKLRPGENTITFEAYTPSIADQSCDLIAGAGEPRLYISGETTLELPTIARIGHLPDLAATTAGLAGSTSGKPISAYLTKLSGATLDSAGTFFGQLAARNGKVQSIRIMTQPPAEQTEEMVAFGQYSELPSSLLAYVGLKQSGIASADAAPAKASTPTLRVASTARDWFFADNAPAAQPASEPEANVALLGSFSQPLNLSARVSELGEQASESARDLGRRALGFIKPNEQEDHAEYSLPASGREELVLAQRPSPRNPAAAWTIVASNTEANLLAGTTRLATPEQWAQLNGAITVISSDGEATSFKAKGERLFETQPRTFQNGRLVIAGWFSRQMERYVAGILLMAVLLGLTTHLFVRSLGKRR